MESKRKKMKQKTAEAMRPIVEAYGRHEGSKRAFCQEQGIAAHTLDYWRRKLKETEPNSSGFVKLEIASRVTEQCIELFYPNGVRAIVPTGVPIPVLSSLLNYTD
jgi:transposase-like protein